ncbi:hypothetical protein D3C81_1114900 [compost metagenome]
MRIHLFSHLLMQNCPGRLLFSRAAFVPSIFSGTTPIPPMIIIGISIQQSFSCDGNVLFFVRIDERRKIDAFHALPTCEYHRIISTITTKEYGCPFADMKVDVAFQIDCTGQIDSLWDYYTSSTLPIARFNCFSKGYSIFCPAISNSTEISDGIIFLFKCRSNNNLFKLFNFL